MAMYYIAIEPRLTGERDIHKAPCPFMPDSRLYLGKHASPAAAMEVAGRHFDKVAACPHCCQDPPPTPEAAPEAAPQAAPKAIPEAGPETAPEAGPKPDPGTGAP
jgi:hypothetical protein